MTYEKTKADNQKKKHNLEKTARRVKNITRWTFGSEHLTATQKIILIVLAHNTDTAITTKPTSMNEIFVKAGLSENATRNNIKKLIDTEILQEVKPKQYKITGYKKIDLRKTEPVHEIRFLNLTRQVFELQCLLAIAGHRLLKSGELIILLAIIDHLKQEKDGKHPLTCYPSYARLIKKTNVSRNTVSESIKVLSGYCFLTWQNAVTANNQNSSNFYTLNIMFQHNLIISKMRQKLGEEVWRKYERSKGKYKR